MLMMSRAARQTTRLRRLPARPGLAGLCVVAAMLASCGGGDNPLGNPPTVQNGANNSGNGKLAFAYFQRCINPILKAQLQTTQNGQTSVNSCASGGCHDTNTGTGGALRVTAAAADVNFSDSPTTIRDSAMYRNYVSSQGVTVIGAPTSSFLLKKPQVNGVLHGGGLIFPDPQDENVKRLVYWISRPAPQGQDEFSTATYTMFTPNDPNTGACNTQ
jgi:hypothetical protein